MLEYIIPCPKCNAQFDVTRQINEMHLEFLGEIEKVVEKLKSKHKE